MKSTEEFVKELNEKFPQEEPFQAVYGFSIGKKFCRIFTSRDGGKTSSCCYGFVDIQTGDLYKAASWAAPAKGIRGNINDPSGLEACNRYGVRYLR